MKHNLVTRTIGSVIVLRQNKQAPTDAEWADLIRQTQTALRTHGSAVRAYIWTAGGAPTPEQRAQLPNEYAKVPFKTAVISDSSNARMTSATVALLNRYHRSFGVDDRSSAQAWLGLKQTEVLAIEKALKEMETELA